ncbi:MAG: hypothetical protein RRC34_16110 [Lentisphaeria bacterium]|nr:hypothetical protein [Lentisphaeria bacterium]
MIRGAALSVDDRRLLDLIQSDFPLAADPYGRLAESLGVSAAATRQAVIRLRQAGIIRRIGGSYVPARLGHVTSLVAAEVDAATIERAAARASGFPNVTHNYERDGRLNLWFTVIGGDQRQLRETVACVAAAGGVREIHMLPALKTFKLKVRFPFDSAAVSSARHGTCQPPGGADGACRPIDAEDKRLIARTCGDIGTGLTPYDDLAGELGMPRNQLLTRLRAYRKDGWMRRFGAIIQHYAAGFNANGLSVWNVPDERVDEIGARFADRREISHCYERPRLPGWPYNLYAMIHGTGQRVVRGVADELAAGTGAVDRQVLFSRREFKKTSMVYFSGETGGHG